MRKILVGIAAFALTAGGSASAAPYRFEVFDPTITQNGVPINSYVFTFDSSPTPMMTRPTSFTLNGFADYSAGEFGDFRVFGDFDFFTASDLGGLNTPLNSYLGEQLFTGSLAAPTFRLGTFALDVGTITISEVADPAPTPMPAVPEPATWAMLIVGFGTIGCAFRRRHRTRVTFA